jgi:6-phosphofructokinase 1
MSRVFVIAQGGGPTAVINATLAGAIGAARRRYPGAKIFGARHGVRGIRNDHFVDLSDMTDADLDRLARTPSAALGSTRDKPDEAYSARILNQLRAIATDAFIYIGGNDTAGTLGMLAAADDGRIALVHAPKTIDNDLVESDHTPGFISAALFVAHAFRSVDLDFQALPGIYVGIVMGRHAGFLTAAAAAWQRSEADGPHLVYVPERAFSIEQFLIDVRDARQRFGRCVVAMSEGVAGADGRPLAEMLKAEIERDAHGNVQLSTGELGQAVQMELAREFPGVRARVDTFGYLPRSFSGLISELDRREAFDAGAYAVAVSAEGSGSVTIGAAGDVTKLGVVPLAAVAGRTRHMPAGFLLPDGRHLSPEGMRYFAGLLPAPADIYAPFL